MGQSSTRRARKPALALLCGAASSAFVLATPWGANAQSEPANVDEIVVTGSRTIKNGNASPTPITVVQSQDLLKVQPGILSDALNALPVFAGSRTTAANPVFNVAVSGGNSSSSGLNLRNLSPLRTLVLMDGNRVPPTSFNNAVDVDIIPQMLIQRVDVVTGGVSAVYGSDAVAGVVNYIIDRRFNGLRVEGDLGVSEQGDARRQVFGVAAGRNLFGGRSHFEASYQYINQSGILARSQRSWLNRVGVTGLGTVANPYVLQTDVRQAGTPFGGLITGAASATNPLGGQTFATDGVLTPFVNGVPTGTNGIQIGGGGGYHDTSLIAPLRTHQVFGRFDHEFSDKLHGFLQVGGNMKRNEGYAAAIRLNNQVMSATNAFLPSVYRAQLAAAGQGTFRFSQLMGPETNYHAIAKTDQWTFVAGLDGSLGKYRWGLNANYGVAKLNTVIENNPNVQNMAAALDAVVNPATGQIVCNASLTNSAYANCVPINVFGPTAKSAAALAYVAPRTSYDATTTLIDFSGHIEGSPFALPAGDVNVALSGEWRKLSFDANTTAPATALMNCTSLRFNCSPLTNVWTISFANTPKVSQSVGEGAIEMTAPLLKDRPFIQSLSVNGAVRYTHYNTSGNYVTWKIGGDWRINDAIKLRATRSRDIRAPTLYELFAPPNPSPVSPPDLLTGQAPTVPSTGRSNPNLRAEAADTTTAGIIITPLPGLSFSIDAYRIKINQAISLITGSTSSLQQLCYASGGSSIWCTFQDRPLGNYTNTSAANTVTHWYTQYLNIAKIDTYGADFEVNYSTRMFGRPAAFRILAAYQPHANYVQPGTPTVDYAGVGFGPPGSGAPQAVWRLSGFAQFQPIENLTVDLLARWRDDMKLSGDPTQVWVNNHIGSFGTLNATVTYDFRVRSGRAQVYFSVSNLFDATPPLGAYSANGSLSGQRDGFVLGDDVVGRAYTLGARLRF